MGEAGYVTKAFKVNVYRNTDSLLQRITDYQVLKGKGAQLTETELLNLAYVVNEMFNDEPACLRLTAERSIYIVGDIFGQYGDLLRLFYLQGFPPYRKYLFLGNYVDRGNRCVETMALLFCLKIRFPDYIYLLRGNHECETVSRHYGFLEECQKRFSKALWKAHVLAFNSMPCACIVEDRIFCMHSGLSPNLMYSSISSPNELKEYIDQHIMRPTDIKSNILLSHLVWSDPDPHVSAWDKNPAGMGLLYSKNIVEEFSKNLNIDLIVRGNEVLSSGFEYFEGNKLLTLFTAPNFNTAFRNDGAILNVDKFETGEVLCRLIIVKPIFKLRTKPTARMNIRIHYTDSGNLLLPCRVVQEPMLRI